MSARTVKSQTLPRGVVVALLLLTVAVLGLGGAVIAVRLRPEPLPTNSIDRAIARWEQTVEENPESTEAKTGLGMALLSAGRPAAATTAFEEAIDLDAKNWVALLQLGLLVKEEDPARAEELLARSVKSAPETERAAPAVAWGDLLMERDDPNGAKTAYRVAIIDAPYVIEGHVGMARVFEVLGDQEAALAEYRYAAQFAPDDPDIAEAIERLAASNEG